MTDTTPMQDPADIERNIRRTQDDMSRTVDKIGDQLTIRNIFNALLDKADENDVDARYLVDGARRNPIALGLIAAGAIWLVSDKDSKFPSVPGKSRKGENADPTFDSDYDTHHRDYVSHMSAIEMRDDEEPSAYQRRRDLHRATFMMCERNLDEDDHSFRQRLDEMTEKFRDKRRAWAESSAQVGADTREKGRMAVSRAQEMYQGNPLIGGILAAAFGAALGSSLPISRQEQEKLGPVGQKARELAEEQTDELKSQALEKKGQLLEKADQALQSPHQTSQANTKSTDLSGGEPSQPAAPFIIGEKRG